MTLLSPLSVLLLSLLDGGQYFLKRFSDDFLSFPFFLRYNVHWKAVLSIHAIFGKGKKLPHLKKKEKEKKERQIEVNFAWM